MATMEEMEEIKELLQANLELTKANNKMLHHVRGVQKRHHIFLAIRWFLIVALFFGAYYYIQPYLNKMIDTYNSISNFGSIDPKAVEELLGRIKP